MVVWAIREQHPIPVLFERSMGAFNGVVLAMVRWIIGQVDADPMLICEVDGSLDELGTPAAVFRPIVQVEHHSRRPVLGFSFCPELFHAIPNVVAGYFGLSKGDE